MSIEKAIAENTAAVEKLTAAILATTKLAPTGATEGKPAGKPAGKPDAAPKASREEMVAALKELGESKGAEVAKEIIKSVGKSAKMADIKDAQVDATYKAAKAKLEEEDAPAEEDGGL